MFWRTCLLLIAGLNLPGLMSAQEVCPAALDFYKRPVAGKEAMHLCDVFREKLL